MLILGIDTATLSCSAALVDENNLLAEYTLNIKRTHSERLMPLVASLLQDSGVDKKDLDGIAVASGPGSFTGLRIGVATVRGLAQGLGIPAVGVNTLDALADAVLPAEKLICPILDARRSQVYTAIYRASSGEVERLINPAALSLEDLVGKLNKFCERVIFVGDALPLYGCYLQEKLGERFQDTSPALRINRGAFVAFRGHRYLSEGRCGNLNDVKPFYIRPSDAERRLAEGKQIGGRVHSGNN